METVNHPKHYNAGKFEVIEIINDQKLNYERGCVIKYVCRAGKKDPAKEREDLQKAIWYLQWEVEKLTAAAENREPRRPNDMNPRLTSATDASTSKAPGSTMGTVQIAPRSHVMSHDGAHCVLCGWSRAPIADGYDVCPP